jgi:hypothetical protein
MKDTDNTTAAGRKEAGYNQEGRVPPRGSSVTPVIDVHRHCMWKAGNSVEEIMEKLFKLKTHWQNMPSGATLTVVGITSIVYPELSDIDIQVQKQDEAGVVLSILSFSMKLELVCRELFFVPDDVLTRMVNDKTAAEEWGILRAPRALACSTPLQTYTM